MKTKLYFIQFGSSGPIKIGITGNLPNRLSHLRMAHHEEPAILATIPGGRVAEKAMHDRFREEHMRGEWFAPSAKLLGFVQEVSLLGHLPGDDAAVEKIEMDALIEAAGLDNDLILFRHHFAECLRKRLYPHTKWTIKSVGESIGVGKLTIQKWLSGLHEPKASTLLRLNKFFEAFGDEDFLNDVYGVDIAAHAKTLRARAATVTIPHMGTVS